MSSQYEYDPTRISGSGEVAEGTAGAAIANRAACYLGADGLYYQADADAAATMPAVALAMSAMTVGQKGEFLVKGFIGLSTWAWTTGSELYISGTAGQMTHTPGFTINQQVGIAYTTTQIFFNPSGYGTGVGVINEEFYPPVESDSYVGQHFGAQMLDNTDTVVGFEFVVPQGFNVLTSAYVIVVQTAAATPNMVWSATTDFASACSTENYNNHEDTTGSQTSLVTQNDLVCLDVSSALTGIVTGDLVGMEFLRDGDNASDTVGGTVLCLGLRMRYR